MKKKDFIVEDIINKINSQVYQEKSKLPTERSLSEQYQVSRYTIRQALEKLEGIGYIYRVQGSGIFVNDSAYFNTLIYNSLTVKKHRDISSQVLSLGLVEADEELAGIFNLKLHDKLWAYKRVRIADARKVQIEYTFMPYYLFPKLTKKDLENSVHRYVRNQHYTIDYFITEYRASNISKEEADLLNCKKGLAIIKIRNRGYLEKNVLFELTDSTNLDYICSYIRKYNPTTEAIRCKSREY